MNILVPIKRVIDASIKPRVNKESGAVEQQHVKMSANPFDEIALEAAVRLKEAGQATDICAVSIGSAVCQDVLRAALAVGADRACLLQAEQEIQPLAVAKLLQALVIKEQSNLVLMGKQAIDDDANQVGQMLAALLNWPQATFASNIQRLDDEMLVEREIDGGHQQLRFSLPGVVTVDLRLNVPRYAKLPDIMRAKHKPLAIVPVDTFDVDIEPRFKTLKIESSPTRRAGIKVQNVDELIDRLRHEAKVII